MITYNGYKPNESRGSTHRPRKADGGHSVVGTACQRRGDAFSFTYSVTCQCGKRYTSRANTQRAWASHGAHKDKEATR